MSPRTMKRPASAGVRPRATKSMKVGRPTVKKSAASAKERGGGSSVRRSGPLAAAREGILRALAGCRGSLEFPVLKAMQSLARRSGRRDNDEEEPANLLEEMLQDIERRLAEEAFAARQIVEGSDADAAERKAAAAAASVRLEELKGGLGEVRRVKVNFQKAADRALEQAEAAAETYKAGQEALQALQRRRELLLTAEQNAFAPLRQAAAEANAAGRNKLKVLKEVGKDFDFNEVLVNVLPQVLRQPPEKRRTFDGLALQSFEREFSKKGKAAAEDIEVAQIALEERARTLELARAAAGEAEQHCEEGKASAVRAEAAAKDGVQILAAARKRLKALKSDMRSAARAASKAEAQLSSFRRGPMKALAKLKAALQDVAQPPGTTNLAAPAMPPLGAEVLAPRRTPSLPAFASASACGSDIGAAGAAGALLGTGMEIELPAAAASTKRLGNLGSTGLGTLLMGD